MSDHASHRWRSVDYGVFVEVVPISDSEEHAHGDECWCTPKVDYSESRPLVIHNSKDGREIIERIFEAGDA